MVICRCRRHPSSFRVLSYLSFSATIALGCDSIEGEIWSRETVETWSPDSMVQQVSFVVHRTPIPPFPSVRTVKISRTTNEPAVTISSQLELQPPFARFAIVWEQAFPTATGSINVDSRPAYDPCLFGPGNLFDSEAPTKQTKLSNGSPPREPLRVCMPFVFVRVFPTNVIEL
ncbi:peptidase M48 Ste24p [Anopheles sinensis]|uniref:Peptidase M48 Ste24p n=1 Tax=Anopheles sinensis TaxID=74873 RepID=A0A084VXW8_ANOSI|nr:peptidase M48 Ste24p [Anopheles sinensis]